MKKSIGSEHELTFKKKAIGTPLPASFNSSGDLFFIFYSFPGSLVASDVSAALGPLQNPL